MDGEDVEPGGGDVIADGLAKDAGVNVTIEGKGAVEGHAGGVREEPSQDFAKL